MQVHDTERGRPSWTPEAHHQDDKTITNEVQVLLDHYAGEPGRWSATVDHGRVTVTGHYTDRRERQVVLALSGTVAGVYAVELVGS